MSSELAPVPPKDKYHAVYFLFLGFGLFSMLPINFFNTATDYWMYKFRALNNTTDDDENILTQDLQVAFISNLNIVSTTASVLCLGLTLFFGKYTSSTKLILVPLVLILIMFSITLIFVGIDTDDWQELFFGVTLLIAGNMCGASAVFRVTTFMILASFPPRFISGILIGLSIGGVFAAVVQIFTLYIAPTSTSTAFLYFLIVTILTFLIILYYVFATRTEFYRYHFENQHVEDKSGRSSFKEMCKKIWVATLALLMDTLITNCIHPSITSVIVSTEYGSGNAWSDVYFIPVIAFLLLNVLELTGKIASTILQKPKNKYVLLILSSVRIVFIPIFLICNTMKHDRLPNLLGDEAYISTIVFFGLSAGYFTNSIAMNVRAALFNKEDLEMIMPIVGITMGISQVLGSFLSLLLVKIL